MGHRVVVVQSDLRQFYDRVRPPLLNERLEAIRIAGDDPRFFAFAKRLLNWNWSPRDAAEVKGYSAQARLGDFANVALPQGLVAAGFFSNVVLLNLDEALRDILGQYLWRHQ